MQSDQVITYTRHTKVGTWYKLSAYLIDKQPRLVLNSRLHGWTMHRAGFHDVLLETVSNTEQPRQLSSPQQTLSCPSGALPGPILSWL